MNIVSAGASPADPQRVTVELRRPRAQDARSLRPQGRSHELDKHIGRDVLRGKDSLGASIRVCSEKVQGATPGVRRGLGPSSFHSV